MGSSGAGDHMQVLPGAGEAEADTKRVEAYGASPALSPFLPAPLHSLSLSSCSLGVFQCGLSIWANLGLTAWQSLKSQSAHTVTEPSPVRIPVSPNVLILVYGI